jgi:hypothetical protein
MKNAHYTLKTLWLHFPAQLSNNSRVNNLIDLAISWLFYLTSYRSLVNVTRNLLMFDQNANVKKQTIPDGYTTRAVRAPFYLSAH